MTPLEQKANKYLSEKCGLTPKDSYYINMQNAYIAGYTEALRWRDVNIERVPCGIKVILKQEDRYVGFGFFYDGSFTHSCNICDKGIRFTKPRFTHWRPIETI